MERRSYDPVKRYNARVFVSSTRRRSSNFTGQPSTGPSFGGDDVEDIRSLSEQLEEQEQKLQDSSPPEAGKPEKKAAEKEVKVVGEEEEKEQEGLPIPTIETLTIDDDGPHQHRGPRVRGRGRGSRGRGRGGGRGHGDPSHNFSCGGDPGFQGGGGGPRPHTCYNCGGLGHFSRDCQLPPTRGRYNHKFSMPPHIQIRYSRGGRPVPSPVYPEQLSSKDQNTFCAD